MAPKKTILNFVFFVFLLLPVCGQCTPIIYGAKELTGTSAVYQLNGVASSYSDIDIYIDGERYNVEPIQLFSNNKISTTIVFNSPGEHVIIIKEILRSAHFETQSAPIKITYVQDELEKNTAAEITEEVLRKNDDPEGHPLPIASTWRTATVTGQVNVDGKWFTGDGNVRAAAFDHIDLIRHGHFVLPVFHFPVPNNPDWALRWSEDAIRLVRLYNLPITLIYFQPEEDLAKNPSTQLQRVDASYLWFKCGGNIANNQRPVPRSLLTPMGSEREWFDVGKRMIEGKQSDWTAGAVKYNTANRNTLGTLPNFVEKWYPNPPKIIFLDNNEPPAITAITSSSSDQWINDKQFIDDPNTCAKLAEYNGSFDINGKLKFGPARIKNITVDGSQNYTNFTNYVRKTFSDKWANLYGQMLNGMRSALSDSWRKTSAFVGYNAFPGARFANNSGGPWNYSTLAVPKSYDGVGRLYFGPEVWDGASVPFYVNPPGGEFDTDYSIESPQIGSMNRPFMVKDAIQRAAKTHNADFWYEISTWNGGEERTTSYPFPQTYDVFRYQGQVQFGMWLTRPRVVREFYLPLSPILKMTPLQMEEKSKEYFMVVVNSVDRIHKNSILKRFWRRGELVSTDKGCVHPGAVAGMCGTPSEWLYGFNEFKDEPRWFLLTTNEDPPRPYVSGGDHSTQFPILALAYKLTNGTATEWLVYAQAPLGPRRNIKITVPDYGVFNANIIAEGGSYFHLVGNDVTEINDD